MKIYKDVVNAYEENFYLYYDEESKQGVLIDPGEVSEILDRFIAEKGIQIQAILLTHGHWDHVQAANHYRLFYQAPVYGPRLEAWLLNNPQPNDGINYGNQDLTIQVDHWFEDGDRLTDFGIQALATPGHTQGCTTFQHEDLLFTGDCLFQGSVGRWDLQTSSYEATVHSIQRLMDLPGNALVYPGHGPMTTLERERAFNPFYQSIREG